MREKEEKRMETEWIDLSNFLDICMEAEPAPNSQNCRQRFLTCPVKGKQTWRGEGI